MCLRRLTTCSVPFEACPILVGVVHHRRVAAVGAGTGTGVGDTEGMIALMKWFFYAT